MCQSGFFIAKIQIYPSDDEGRHILAFREFLKVANSLSCFIYSAQRSITSTNTAERSCVVARKSCRFLGFRERLHKHCLLLKGERKHEMRVGERRVQLKSSTSLFDCS